jgi:hypothetical protein
MLKSIVVLLLLQFVLPTFVAARELSGVSLPETLSAKGVETALALNGAGVRQRFFTDIYVAALYLPRKTSDIDEILAERGPRIVDLHFVYKDVPARRLIDGWVDGFRFNHTSEEFRKLESRLQQLNTIARDLHRGEAIRLELQADGRTDVAINGQHAITISGTDFQRALLKIWLGEKPVDAGLRRALLGRAE